MKDKQCACIIQNIGKTEFVSHENIVDAVNLTAYCALTLRENVAGTYSSCRNK